jgi:primosomal protein N' (replication factor Y)
MEPVLGHQLPAQLSLRLSGVEEDNEATARVIGINRKPFARASPRGDEPGKSMPPPADFSYQPVAQPEDVRGHHRSNLLSDNPHEHSPFRLGGAMIARVEPLTSTRAVRGPFDYRLRADQAHVEVGSLLRVPFGGRKMFGVVVALVEHSELDPERLAEPDTVLPVGTAPDLLALARWMAHEYCSTFSRALSLVLAPGATTGARPKRSLVAELTEAGSQALGDGIALNERQRMLLADLNRLGPTVAAELGTPALRRLESRGLVSLDTRVMRRRPARHQLTSTSSSAPVLNAEQQEALESILLALGAAGQRPREFLLHGVTGSGKTEIYLEAVRATLAAGAGAIVLVPEISLTPQALARFQARLGDVVAVMHSGMSDGARHDEWLRLRSGQARVCVGPRSAVFAPLTRIGLIVVDEEHEGSYKHEGDPRYDARTVAQHRAHEHGAVLVVGSATPRPESVFTLPRLRLRGRIDGLPLPPVEILDMRGQHHPLHPETRMALADIRRSRGKAVVLLNRRGWSNFLSCRSCGRVWMCPNCDVALVLHRSGNAVACHHCGHRKAIPSRCPECASVALARHGAGTERIERELAAALGQEGFPVLRLDADASGLQQRARTLERFAAAPAGVLVGTQMVAKGHDFPDVGLGVVLDADQTLRFPDFRAEERTFALITQLAGRAGRSAAGGRVLVQTTAPEARSIRFAIRHDSEGFVRDELARRETLSYPPFASLVRVICSAESATDAHGVAGELRDLIAPAAGAVLGPAPLFRLRGRARTQLVIKAHERAPAIDAVGTAVDTIARSAARRSVSVSVDVDPQ